MRWRRKPEDVSLHQAKLAVIGAEEAQLKAAEIKGRIDIRLVRRAKRAEQVHEVILNNGFGKLFDEALREGKHNEGS